MENTIPKRQGDLRFSLKKATNRIVGVLENWEEKAYRSYGNKPVNCP